MAALSVRAKRNKM